MAPPSFAIPNTNIRGLDLQSPFSAHLGNPITANTDTSSGAIAEVRAYIDTFANDLRRFDGDIEQLDALLVGVRQHRKDGDDHLRRHREIIAPAYTLPTELWARIFAMSTLR